MNADIKFCGLTRAEDADYAAAIGAAYVGVIFAGGPRMLTVERAGAVLMNIPRTVKRVGVFAGQTPADIARAADRLQLHVVQLHAVFDADRIAEVRQNFAGEIWAVASASSGVLPANAEELMSAADGLLLDAFVDGKLGGTGVALPWAQLSASIQQLRRSVEHTFPTGARQFVLAGGLNPGNVAAAIAAIAPNVVDVSSGVEQAPGIKDPERMRAFCDAVRSAPTVAPILP